MSRSSYSALIRTFNSENTLPSTIRSLENQTSRPTKYVIVDSGSTDATLNLLPPGCVVHRFHGACFNYSEALNQGLQYVSTEYVLIISSHTALANPNAVECAVNILNADQRIGTVSFDISDGDSLKHDIIDETNFNGFNGLWNTCCIVRVPLLKKRPFRPDVFTAEDKEWARWLLFEEHMVVACLLGAGMVNNNPRAASMRKRVNEYTSVAYFSNRRLLGWSNLARIAFMAVTPSPRVGPRRRFYHLWLLWRLVGCHIRKPEASSRYF
jgi:glycosyltransferase involved in cell wall biosynthesis